MIRMQSSHPQDPHALSAYLTSHSNSSSNFLCLMADFHLLFFLYTSDIAGIHMRVSLTNYQSCHLPAPYSQAHIPSLCRAILEGDKAGGDAWRHSEHWSTIEQLVAGAHASPAHTPGPPAAAAVAQGEHWSCVQCTLLNAPSSAVCDACQFPRVAS